MVVGRDGVRMLRRGNESFLLAPELLDRLLAPLDALLVRPDGLVADHDPDGVRVCRVRNSQRHPAALIDLDVIELEFLLMSVGSDDLLGDLLTVNDQLD